MSLDAINNPQITARTENSIGLNWAHVFPAIEDKSYLQKGLPHSATPQILPKKSPNERIYDLRMQDDADDWRIIYWGRRTETVVSNLQMSTRYTFKIKLTQFEETYQNGGTSPDGEGLESHWLEFQAATTSDQHHVRKLTKAIKSGKMANIRRIITARPYLLETPNSEDKTPLLQATERGDLPQVRFLCSLGANVNAQSPSTSRTPLMIALFHGFVGVAKHLLSRSALINLRDAKDRTALHYAIDSDDLEAVTFAIDSGAELNARDHKGWTPLLRAGITVILEVQDDVIRLLLRKGSDCDAVDQRGADFRKHLELTNRTGLLKRAQII